MFVSCCGSRKNHRAYAFPRFFRPRPYFYCAIATGNRLFRFAARSTTLPSLPPPPAAVGSLPLLTCQLPCNKFRAEKLLHYYFLPITSNMVGIVQLAEHRIVVPGVVGSSPITHPISGVHNGFRCEHPIFLHFSRLWPALLLFRGYIPPQRPGAHPPADGQSSSHPAAQYSPRSGSR